MANKEGWSLIFRYYKTIGNAIFTLIKFITGKK